MNFDEAFRLAVGRAPTLAETKKCQLYQRLIRDVEPPLDPATVQYIVSLGAGGWPPTTRDLALISGGAFISAALVAIAAEVELHPQAMLFLFMGAIIAGILGAFAWIQKR